VETSNTLIPQTIFLLLSFFISTNYLTGKSNDGDFAIDQEYVKLSKKFALEGENKKAITFLKKALELNPKNRTACFDLGAILYNDKQTDEALEYFEKTLKIDPTCSQAYFNAAICRSEQNDLETSQNYLEKAISLNPKYKKAYKTLGEILIKDKQYKKLVMIFKEGIIHNPYSFEISYYLGKALRAMEKIDEAISYFRKAKQLNPTNIGVTLELANTLNMADKTEESLELYQKVLKTRPDLKHVKYNMAYTMKKLGMVEESIAVYKEVLKTDPGYAAAHFSLGLAYLTLGNFKRGLAEHEWRWKAYRESPKKYDQPIWKGENPAGRTIMLYAEQGLGDTFQFIRYAKILNNLGAKVVVQVQRPLAKIISLCDYIHKVVPRGKPLPDFDYHLPIMSLPFIFKTDIDTIPDNIPYLSADNNLVEEWKKTLSNDQNFKIGICWQGNSKYSTQALRHAVAAKSISLKLFKQISDIPGVTLYSLQKTTGEEQLKGINQEFIVHTLGEDFDKSSGSFMDTAAVIKNLNLVITIDTSIAHLAGGLGAPVWIILPKPADWRWMLKTTKTPWYPNARLFRQTKSHDWENIISEVSEAVKDILENQDLKYKQKKIYTPENKTFSNSISKKAERKKVYDKENIEDVLDKLIVMKVKYDNTNNPAILDEIETLHARIASLESIFNQNQSGEIGELTEQLYEINNQLWRIEEEISSRSNNSIFDKDFVNLIKKAHAIHTLKSFIKNKIKNVLFNNEEQN